jgi:hypothetical protein
MINPEPADSTVPEADRPWERPGAVRCDAEPDRSRLLLALGVTALLLAPVGGAVLGAVVWSVADKDIRKMRAGRMHSRRRWDAERGRQLGMAAVFYATLMYAVIGSMVLLQILLAP